MAVALARRELAERGLAELVEVASAGLYARPGEGPSPQAVAVMGELGIDLRGHRAGQLTPQDAAGADLVLVMTAGHRRAVREMAPEAGDKIHTLAAYAGEEKDVPDPFGGSTAVYRRCVAEMRPLVARAVDRLIREWFPERAGDEAGG